MEAETIRQTLERNPGLLAREIAERIGADKKDVNSTLYGQLQHAIVQDARYRWYLVKDAPKELREEEPVPDTVLAKLSQYYLDCLTHGDSEGVSVFATSKYSLDYCEIEEWPYAADATSPFASEEAKKLLGQARKAKFEKTIYFGYPVFLRKYSGSKGVYTFVEPLFLYACEFDPNDRFALPTLQRELPWLNLKALDSLPIEAGDSALQESIRLTELLGLDRSDLDPEDFDEVMARLRSARPDWRWVEEPIPNQLSLQPPLAEVSDPGLYNRAVLVAAERSRYTWGLETELSKLMRLEPEDYEDTALGTWLAGSEIRSSVPANEPLLEVLPLNSEQRDAVLQGLNNDLTVVTGPPGTGKSQVVTSILVNAAWQGTKVLFASKNNKAVDVVEERVNALGPRPVLLRLGSNDYQRQLGEYLSSLLSGTATDADGDRYRETEEDLNRIRSEFTRLEERLDEVIELRNATDELERKVEPARRLFSSEAFESLAQADIAALEEAVGALVRRITQAVRSEQGLIVRLFWFAVKSGRYAAVRNAAVNASKELKILEAELPAPPRTKAALNPGRSSREKYGVA